MSTYKNLTTACIAAALALGLAACSSGDDSADVTPVEPPPTPAEPQPQDVTMDVALGPVAQARLLDVLGESGTSDTLTIEAGGMATRGEAPGVVFTCMSAYPCTVTVTNSLGTILASVTTQMLPDADDPVVTAGLPDPVDTFAILNDGSTGSIRLDVVGADADAGSVGPDFTLTELIGMEIGGPGVLNTDEAALRSDFQANGAGFGESPGDAAAGPGAVPTLTMGTTVTGAGDAIDASDDMESAPAGWDMMTLFRDWGDTAGDGDGGFETAAIVVNDLGEGTTHPFDRDLSDRYVNAAAQAMFALNIRADGSAPGVTTLGTSVDIDGSADASPAAAPVQWANMVFDGDSLVPAQSQDLNVNMSETFTGSYFGAPGRFQCIAAADESCALARNADGTVGIPDTDADTDGIQNAARWSFTPDPGAEITVPDQDWMAYGAWLTTPDDLAGDHRLGVFFNGMDPWAPAANSLDATNAAGLRGSATYSGGATGIYVDGADSGLFTARATLTADFDADIDGVDDTTDYMISGRIDNFRGTNGVALGADTGDMPNPQGRGENDWTVELGAFDFGETTDGLINATGTTGSADGVSWTGMWNGQMFGPTMDADGDPVAPSGVAGRFWAETADPDTTDAAVNPVTAVVGAFGADID